MIAARSFIALSIFCSVVSCNGEAIRKNQAKEDTLKKSQNESANSSEDSNSSLPTNQSSETSQTSEKSINEKPETKNTSVFDNPNVEAPKVELPKVDTPVSTPAELIGKTRTCTLANRNCDYEKTWNVFFIGNSGTDELGTDNKGILPSVSLSANRKMNLWRSSMPGAPMEVLWDNRTKASYGERDILLGMKNRGPLSQLILMPIYRSSAKDIEIGGKFFKEALSHSPRVQLWLYAVWASTVNGTEASWEVETRKILTQTEDTRLGIDNQNEGLPVRIVPGGLAFVKMRDAVAQSKIPGVSNFKSHFFKDNIHLTDHGTYFMSLVYYAAWYNVSPEINVTSNGPASVLQALEYKKIAWDVVSNYAFD